MKRTIQEKLQQWKEQAKRKPLILMGARQVGKTYAIKKFGEENYQNTAYLNFEDNPRLCELFKASLAPDVILKAISIELDIEIITGGTLLIFDEVQECPEALNSLK